MNINNNQFLSIEQLKDQYFTDSKPKTQTSGVGSFKDIFDRINEESQGSELKFSKHAISRLSTREITLDVNGVLSNSQRLLRRAIHHTGVSSLYRSLV